jgi:hypothetical protein
MKQVYVVFISLLIDLLAFTCILPLLPKIFEYYESNKNVSGTQTKLACRNFMKDNYQ